MIVDAADYDLSGWSDEVDHPWTALVGHDETIVCWISPGDARPAASTAEDPLKKPPQTAFFS